MTRKKQQCDRDAKVQNDGGRIYLPCTPMAWLKF